MTTRRPNSHRRFFATVCLVVFVLGCSGLLPDLLACAAYLDGSHEVRLSCDDGHFELILHHPEANAAAGATSTCAHHHGWAARVLCVLSESRDFDPDHILHGTSGFVMEPDDGAVTATPADQLTPAPWSASFTNGGEPAWIGSEYLISPHYLSKGWSPPALPSRQSFAMVLLI